MYWTINQFPELDHLAPAQRAELLRRVPRGTYAGIIVRSVIVGGLAAFIIEELPWPRLDLGIMTIIGLAVAIAAGAACYLFHLRQLRNILRRELAAGFQGQRPPFCFHCGYDLRGAADPRCPECGGDTTLPPTP